jgi:5-methylcytosine-specific restriction endonuclease McrA
VGTVAGASMTRTLGSFERRARQRSPWLDIKAWEAGWPSYGAYLESEHWIALRARIFRRDQHRCCHCGSTRRLTVHHITYARLGSERLADLQTLCARCHQRLQKQWRQRKTLRTAIGNGKRPRRQC